MDKASIGGVLLAIVGIVAGLLIEGGNLGQILQPTAALIVFGGTMGAVLLQFPLTTVVAAFRKPGAHLCRAAQARMANSSACWSASPTRRAATASSRSMPTCKSIEDPFLKQTLMLAVDGTEPARAAQDHARQPRLHHRR